MAEALNELWVPRELLPEDDNSRPLPDLGSYEEEFLEKEDMFYCTLPHKPSSGVMARSPPSTLCDMESWVKPKFPPHAPSNLLPSHIQTPPTQRVYPRTEFTDGFYRNPSLLQQKLRVAQFCHNKRQQGIPLWTSHSRDEYGKAKGCLTYLSDSKPLQPPPAHKQQPGSGMRAVFLNIRKESSGTGVFLPRRTGSHSKPREKPACSAALLPLRVVRVLNLDLDDLGIHPRLPTNESSLARNQGGTSSRPLPISADVRLPPEWTY